MVIILYEMKRYVSVALDNIKTLFMPSIALFETKINFEQFQNLTKTITGTQWWYNNMTARCGRQS